MRRLRDSAVAFGVVGFIITAALLIPAGAASAHRSLNYYNPVLAMGYWPRDHTATLYVRSTGFPNSGFADRTRDAAARWNSASSDGNDADYYYIGTTTATGNFDSPCSSQYTGVYWHDPGTGYLAVTKMCKNSSGIAQKFGIAVDDDYPWYSGTGTTSYYDFWSVITHELGHGTSFSGHFGAVDDCVEGVNKQTMCSTITEGTVDQRSLGVHDLHTYQDAW